MAVIVRGVRTDLGKALHGVRDCNLSKLSDEELATFQNALQDRLVDVDREWSERDDGSTSPKE